MVSNRVIKQFTRIMERTKQQGDCFIYTGPTSGNKGRGKGYGRISINDRTSPVHRVMATLFYGYIPPNMHVDHLCNNRLCVNPAHLDVVTHKKNQKERARRRVEREMKFGELEAKLKALTDKDSSD